MIDVKDWYILYKKDGKINHCNKISPLVSAIVLSVLFLLPTIASAATYYVSVSGSASWANSTNISTPCSLATALANADDDDIVYLRGGTYDKVYDHGVFEPDNSGSKGHPITFIAYPDETPIIDGSNTGGTTVGYLFWRSYITIDGLTFSNPTGKWSIITGGNGSRMEYDVIIQNCTFNTKGVYSKSLDNLQVLNNTFSNITGAGVNISGHATHKSTNTKISGNIFTGSFSGTDVIVLHSASSGATLDGVGSYHLIENNTITRTGGENCIDIESGKYVVVRGNTCTGSTGKAMFIVGGDNYDSNYVEFVRFESNIAYNNSAAHMMLTGEDRDNIQFIRNMTYGTGAHNIRLVNSASIAHNGVRIAHNTLDGRVSGDSINLQVQSTEGSGITDVRIKNNIIIVDTKISSIHWQEPGAADMLSDYNLYWNYGESLSAELWGYTPKDTLAEIRNSYHREIKGMEANPLFSDLSGRDYSLQSDSPAINAGGWLTTITSATGSGRSFKVDDPLWFYDGWNIIGEKGDKTKTENGQSATITLINYDTGEITVDKSISWTKGEGIGLHYEGIRPDIGAKEDLSGTSPISIPSSPTGLRVISN